MTETRQSVFNDKNGKLYKVKRRIKVEYTHYVWARNAEEAEEAVEDGAHNARTEREIVHAQQPQAETRANTPTVQDLVERQAVPPVTDATTDDVVNETISAIELADELRGDEQ